MTDQKFSRKLRLTKRDQFINLFTNAKFKKSENFIVYYKKNDLNFSRLGITLKGKTSSIIRNKLKRIIREWFRKNQSSFSDGYDVNVVLKINKLLDLNFIEKVKQELNNFKL
jgi:ribonuclease P protein component